jgi:dTDP-4-dehydrorhamnose 3,5-epimerase-like enzyme
VNVHLEKCPAYHDSRGDLIQFVTSTVLEKNKLAFGQIYLLTFNGNNTIRGNHYHNNSCEIFCLVSGSVEMIFEEVETKTRLQKVITSANNEFFRIFIGEKIAHAVRNISDFAVMISFSSKEFDSKEEDRIPYILM